MTPEDLLREIEHGQIKVLARDLTEPSPLALEILAARPYAYLDDAPLEARRVPERLAEPLAVDTYERNRSTGAFILAGEATNDTVAAGMVVRATA